METDKKRLGIIRILFITLAVSVLLLYLYVSNVVIPKKVIAGLKGFEEKHGIMLNVEKVNFDLISGLVLKGITASGEGKEQSAVLIKEIKIKPGYTETIRSNRYIIDSVGLESPRVDSVKELIELIGNIEAGAEEKAGEETPVDLQRIYVNDLVITPAGGIDVALEKLDIVFPQADKEEKTYRISGHTALGSDNRRVDFSSEIKIAEDRKIDVTINIPDVEAGTYFQNIKILNGFSATISSAVDYREGFAFEGSANFKGAGERKIGAFEWRGERSDYRGAYRLEFLKGGVDGLITMELAGRMGKLPGDGVAELDGRIDIPDLSVLTSRFALPPKYSIFGSLLVSRLEISTPQGSTVIRAGLGAGDFTADLGEGDLLKFDSLDTKGGISVSLNEKNGGKSLVIKGSGIKTENFSYLGFESASTLIEALSLNYESGIWDLSLNSKGPDLKNDSFDTEVSNYTLSLLVNYDKSIDIKGNIKAESGIYAYFILKSLAAEFTFIPGRIGFSKADAEIENYGNIFVEEGAMIFPGELSSDYLLEIEGGKYSYFDNPVGSEDIKGLFNIKLGEEKKPEIEGRVQSARSSLYGAHFEDLVFDLKTDTVSYRLGDINARFLNGKFSGALDFTISEGEIDYRMMFNVKGPKLSGMNMESIGIKSNGAYKGGVFSEMASEIYMRGMKSGSGDLNSVFKLKAGPETISIDEGFIANESNDRFNFHGALSDYGNDTRILNIQAPEIPLEFVIDWFSDYLPGSTFLEEVNGSISIDFEAVNFLGEGEIWNGKLKVKEALIAAYLSDTEFRLENMEGSITIKEDSEARNRLLELVGGQLAFNRDLFYKYLNILKEEEGVETEDYLRIGSLTYGFLTAENIEFNFEMDRNKINLLFFKSDLYKGKVYGSGLINLGDGKDRYNFNLLFSDLSLRNISDSLPSMEGYITGVVDGLLWFSLGDSYTTINGPFAFWAKDSREEKRTIGRALLEKIGAKGRFFTGSSRRYDRGELAGYISDGFITFKKLIISNKILGYNDLKIQVDDRKNSITVKHLLSVIRELARRASKGDIEIEYQ